MPTTQEQGNNQTGAGITAAPSPVASPAYFPRGTAHPRQSPLFWVAEKDRYLRQLLIRDIEVVTGRPLLVYFTDCEVPNVSAQIHPSDDVYFIELLRGYEGKEIDLLLETNGGYTDAAEKIIALLQNSCTDLRVIVPRRAKSNGTLIALASSEIVMGPGSELGPIDPNIPVGPNESVPAQFIIALTDANPIVRQSAVYALAQTNKLATKLLTEGMFREKPGAIAEVVAKLASRDHFHSHGSVIDAKEAMALGLNVNYMASDDELWKLLWLLRCMYAYDMPAAGVIKIFENSSISNSLKGA